MTRDFALLSIGCMVLTLSACAQAPITFTTPPANQQYEVLGEGYGSAGGALLFGFIPIQYNSRFQRAQQAAIASKGGDLLINPVVTEKWWWAYIMTGNTTTVTGTVVKTVPTTTRSSPASPARAPQPRQGKDDLWSQLSRQQEQLNEQRQKNLITEEQFQTRSKELWKKLAE